MRFLITLLSIAMLVACDTNNSTPADSIPSEATRNGGELQRIDFSNHVGTWESQSLTFTQSDHREDNNARIKIVISTLDEANKGLRPVPSEFDDYLVAMYEKRDEQSEWAVLPDSANGWIDRSNPSKVFIRLGPFGSHHAFQVSFTDNLMILTGGKFKAELAKESVSIPAANNAAGDK